MRGGLPRLACLLGTLAALCWAAPASAAQPRIINGDAASTGEYPAQGYLRLRVGGDTFSCGGTLLTPTKFVTAAHCATDGNGDPLAPSAFSVRLGSNDRDSGGTLHDVARNEVHEDYDAATFDNDVAVLTLATASSQTPLGLIRTDQTALWEPDDVAWVVGWGTTSNAPGDPGSDLLREADVPIRSDASCGDLLAYGADFHPATMVCAGGGGTMSDSDTCAGDSGGPLLVPDVPPFVLAGITSWGDLTCNHPTRPGVYTRLGAPALNAWVRGRRAGLDFSVTPSTPTAGQPATLTAISQGASGYTWDLDGDQVFDDARGASVSHTFPSAGQRRVGVRAADAEAQPAETRRIVSVAAATASPGPTATPSPAPVPAPPAPAVTPVPLPRTPLATILAARRPKVVRGRFSIRIRYSTAAPTGIATVEVFRARRKIGTARIRVARGTTRRASVKLNKAGRRLLRRSNRKKLRVTVKVRVGRTQLASRRLTIRR